MPTVSEAAVRWGITSHAVLKRIRTAAIKAVPRGTRTNGDPCSYWITEAEFNKYSNSHDGGGKQFNRRSYTKGK